MFIYNLSLGPDYASSHYYKKEFISFCWQAIDTVYFNGFGQDGTFFALRLARRQNREGEVWVLLNLPEIGFFQHAIHPDTTIYNMGTEEFVGGGCRVQMLDPMRRWKLSYNGVLR